MIRIIALCSLSALAFLSHLVHGFGVGTDPSINTNLLRYKLNDTDFKFDLSQIQVNNTPRELGGGNNNAVAFTFNRPNLAGYGVAQSRVQLLPFGFNLPHVHPRGTELLYVINGNVTAGFVEENGGRTLINELGNFQSMIFPHGGGELHHMFKLCAGLVHWYQNNGCSVAEITAFFNWDDPGTITLGVALARLPQDALRASFNIDAATANILTASTNETITENLHLKTLPMKSYLVIKHRASSILNDALYADNYFQHGIPECLARCGLKKK